MQKCKSVRLLQFQATSGREVDEVDEVNKIKKIKKSMPAWLLAYHKIIDCQINTNLITDLIGVIKKIFIRFNMRHYEIKGFSRFSRFLAVFVSFSYFSSYFATTENQVLHAYKDWTGLISKDVLSKDVLSSADIISSEDINESVSLDVNVNVSLDINEDMTDIADMAVSNDIPASSDNDSNDNFDSNDNSFVSFDSLVSHDTNDTGNTADTEEQSDTEDSAEDSAEDTEADSVDLGNTVDPVAPVPSGPDEDNNPNNTNNENNENNDNNPDDSDSIAVLTTRLTSDHHLIATLSISGVMGADVAVFPSVTGHGQHNNDNAVPGNATAPDSAGGNIYTVSNTASSPVSADTDNAEKPDSLLLNFENEEGVVESVRLWLDNEIDETVILDGITAASEDNGNTINTSTDMADFSSRVYDGNISQPDLPRLAVPLSDLSYSSSSDLAAISDTVIPNASGDVNTGYTLDWFIGLDQLRSPVIVILPDTNEQYYFPNGTALANYANFAQEYRVAEVRATTRAEIEVRLEKRK